MKIRKTGKSYSMGYAFCVALTAIAVALSGSAHAAAKDEAVKAVDDGSGNQGVKVPGFILKYENHPKFITHDHPEPGDAANAWLAKEHTPSADFPWKHKFVNVHGANIAYIDEGKGDPIVFIHGAPERTFIWRKLIPYLLPYGRVIAFDHIGHGLSDKPDVEYKFTDYVKYTEGFFNALNLKNMTLIIHDWGTVIGLDYAARNPKDVRGVAMMEALCAPWYPIKNIKEASQRKGKAGALNHYLVYKSDKGWDLAVNQNMFIEQTFGLHAHFKMSQRVWDTYRDPFRKPEYRKPLYMWARQVSIEGDVPETEKAMERYNKWLQEKTIPSMEVYGYPGEVTEEYDVRWRVERMKNHETAFIGAALHFVQEDQPEQVGRAIADWYRRNLAPNPNVWMTDAKP